MDFKKYNIADLGTAILDENIDETIDNFSIAGINNLPGSNAVIYIGEKDTDGSVLYWEKWWRSNYKTF